MTAIKSFCIVLKITTMVHLYIHQAIYYELYTACMQITIMLNSFLLWLMLQIFSVLTIVCGTVTLSRMRERQISCSNRYYRLSETTTKHNPLLICSALLPAVCGVALLLEMILLTVSFVLKCNKIFAIMVSYMCTHPSNYLHASVSGFQLT